MLSRSLPVLMDWWKNFTRWLGFGDTPYSKARVRKSLQGLADEQLLSMKKDETSLTPEGRSALAAELQARGLDKREKKPNQVAKQHGPRTTPSQTPIAGPSDIDLLKVQLFSAIGRTAYIEIADRSAMVTRELAKGLYAVLVRDFGGSESTVSFSDLKKWNAQPIEALGTGLTNTCAKSELPNVQKLTLDCGETAALVMGNGSFISSMALALTYMGTVFQQEGANGWVFSVPNWHAMLAHAVTPKTADTLKQLSELTAKLYDYDDAVSDKLFWIPNDYRAFDPWVEVDVDGSLPWLNQ